MRQKRDEGGTRLVVEVRLGETGADANMTISPDVLLRITIPLAASVVSIAVAIISWSQLQISREKLRLDLFNRRFDIFQCVLDFH